MPNRIISLVPSQTELLFDLGLNAEVIGITKFCIHPDEWFRTKTRIGGTKTVDIEKVQSLSPDLIIANKEENVKEQIEALEEIAPVYVSDIKTLGDAIEMIQHVGKLVSKEDKAKEIILKIREEFKELKISLPNNHPGEFSVQTHQLNAAYLIWKDPYMAAGGDTFIDDMMKHCGLRNVFANKNRYPEISIAQLGEMDCDLLLLSSEPYPFNQKHIDELQQQLRGIKILLVDGEMFSWYGSRLIYSAGHFKNLLQEFQQHK